MNTSLLPPFIIDQHTLDWDVLFQIYEFAEYAAAGDALTRSEADFIEQALRLDDDAAILDVACGGGRHALEMARRGYAVEGIDNSAALVSYAAQCAHEEALRARFVQGDMRALAYEQQFDALLLMNSSLGFFSEADDVATLAGCARALLKGGRLLLQCLNPYQIVNYLSAVRTGWHTLANGFLLREAHFAPATAQLHMNYRFLLPAHGIDAQHPGDHIRLYGYPELKALLLAAGLRPTAVFGDALASAVPFEEDSQWQVVVAEKM